MLPNADSHRTDRGQCENCHCVSTCLFASFRQADQTAWLSEAGSNTVKRGEHLYHQGEAIKALQIVKSGSFKSYFYSEDGCEQIACFHYPGDTLGIDALTTGCHHSNAMALETSSVCRIHYSLLNTLGQRNQSFWPSLFEVSARQVAERDVHAFVISQKSARERLAWLLNELSGGFSNHGFCRNEFNLSMSRSEIANYLAMAVETVSRLFSDFEAEGILRVKRRFVHINDPNALAQLAGVALRADTLEYKKVS